MHCCQFEAVTLEKGGCAFNRTCALKRTNTVAFDLSGDANRLTSQAVIQTHLQPYECLSSCKSFTRIFSRVDVETFQRKLFLGVKLTPTASSFSIVCRFGQAELWFFHRSGSGKGATSGMTGAKSNFTSHVKSG